MLQYSLKDVNYLSVYIVIKWGKMHQNVKEVKAIKNGL